GKAEQILQPGGQGEAVPAFDVMRLDDRLRFVIGRAAEADADAAKLSSFQAGVCQEFRHGAADLLADAFAAGGGIDAVPPQAEQRAVAATNPQLQFRAADLNSEEHELPQSSSSSSFFGGPIG